jgi:PAS domain-containing protein
MGPINYKEFNEEIESSFSNNVNSPDAFVAINYDFYFLYLNRMAEKFYNRKADQIVGLSIATVFPNEWKSGPFKEAQKNVAARKHFELKYNLPFSKEWVQLTGRPFENYYTFTYHPIDYKELLKNELRKEFRKKH